LFDLIKKRIEDEDVLWLIKEVIDSFAEKQIEREREREREREYKEFGSRNSVGKSYIPIIC